MTKNVLVLLSDEKLIRQFLLLGLSFTNIRLKRKEDLIRMAGLLLIRCLSEKLRLCDHLTCWMIVSNVQEQEKQKYRLTLVNISTI
jgi:hypothetical protein